MKTILTALMVLALVGCESKNVEQKESDYTINGNKLSIYVIDGCEYLGTVYGSNSDKLTHKGNCKNHGEKDSVKVWGNHIQYFNDSLIIGPPIPLNDSIHP